MKEFVLENPTYNKYRKRCMSLIIVGIVADEAKRVNIQQKHQQRHMCDVRTVYTTNVLS